VTNKMCINANKEINQQSLDSSIYHINFVRWIYAKIDCRSVVPKM